MPVRRAGPHDGFTRKALVHLRRADPVLAEVIRAVGPYRPRPRGGRSHFHELVRAILYQQLSGKAASTIHGRVVLLFPPGRVDPDGLLRLGDEALQAAGVSRQKARYLRDLADKVRTGVVPLDRMRRMSDETVIAHLVQVKGVGRWTAQMFLMFKLGRPDVLPELDLGTQNAIRRAYRVRGRVTPDDVRRIGAPWTPYSSVACWYLWRSLE